MSDYVGALRGAITEMERLEAVVIAADSIRHILAYQPVDFPLLWEVVDEYDDLRSSIQMVVPITAERKQAEEIEALENTTRLGTCDVQPARLHKYTPGCPSWIPGVSEARIDSDRPAGRHV